MPRKSAGGPYPDNWKAIATACKDLAGWRCIRCGHPHGDRSWKNPIPIEQAGPLWQPVCVDLKPCDSRCTHPQDGSPRVLTVHHLDMNPANCRWWNLTALCQVCHLKIQARVIMERPYFFEHSEWFKPYVAGYYANHFEQNDSWLYVHEHIEELIALGQGIRA